MTWKSPFSFALVPEAVASWEEEVMVDGVLQKHSSSFSRNWVQQVQVVVVQTSCEWAPFESCALLKSAPWSFCPSSYPYASGMTSLLALNPLQMGPCFQII